MSERQVLRRPKRQAWPLPEDRDELLKLIRRRDAIDGALELERHLHGERLDERLRRAGFDVPDRSARWPRASTVEERTRQPMRRGPEVWGDRVRAYVR